MVLPTNLSVCIVQLWHLQCIAPCSGVVHCIRAFVPIIVKPDKASNYGIAWHSMAKAALITSSSLSCISRSASLSLLSHGPHVCQCMTHLSAASTAFIFTNCIKCHQGHEVNRLMSSSNRAGFSNFTYWVPAPPPPSPVPSGSGSILDSSSSSDEPNPIKVTQGMRSSGSRHACCQSASMPSVCSWQNALLR